MTQNPDGKTIFDNVLYVKDFLQECPKWRPFKEGDGDAAKKKRPPGKKKQKQMNKDIKVLKKLATTGNTDKEKSLTDHRLAQKNFMEQVGTGMSAFTNLLSKQNDVKLLKYMSPRSRGKMAKQMMKLKMERIKASIPMSTIGTTHNVEASGISVITVNTAQRPVQRSQAQREEGVDDEEDEDEGGDDVIDVDDDSPGDNRVRQADGTLVLPQNLVVKYAALKRQRQQEVEEADSELGTDSSNSSSSESESED
jgi:NACalpha-BTF3-like transcription factor